MMKLSILVFLLGVAAFAQLPEAPKPQPKPQPKTWEEFKGKPATFWTFRGSPNDPALRTQKQVFHSKIVVASQAIGIASMIVACKRKNSREEFFPEIPDMAGVVALDVFVADRFFTRSYAIAPMIYATVHYSIAAAR